MAGIKLAAIFAFLLLAFSALPGLAAENKSSEIMRLNFYPHQGIFSLSSSIISSISDQSASTNNINTNTTYNKLLWGGAYGVKPGLRLALSDTLLWDQVADSGLANSNGEGRAATSMGFSNPNVTTTWRILEEETGISGDLGVNFSLSLGPKIIANASPNTIGNNYDGYSSVLFFSSWFWQSGFNEFEISCRASHSFNGRTNGNGPSNSFLTLPMWAYALVFADRVHLSTRLFLEAGATYSFAHSMELAFDDETLKKQKTPDFLDPKLEIGLLPDPFYLLALSVSMHNASTKVVNENGTQMITKNNATIAQLTFLQQF